MKNEIKPTKRETRPEQYLREIRDLQLQNNELLHKLYGAEEDKVSRKHWATGFKIAGMLLPYIFSMFVAWTFYAKVIDVFNSFTSTITDIPSSIASGTIPESLKDNVGSGLDIIKEGGAVLWDNRDQIYEEGKEKVNSYIIE